MFESFAAVLPGELLARSVDLCVEGSRNCGWRKADALEVTGYMEDSSVLILGGDVWKYAGGRFRPAHDNWHCQSVQGSSHDDDVRRCAAKAREYVSSYRVDDADDHLFELVISPAWPSPRDA